MNGIINYELINEYVDVFIYKCFIKTIIEKLSSKAYSFIFDNVFFNHDDKI